VSLVARRRCDSDLDLLVTRPAEIGLLTLGRLTGELEQLLNVRVDVVPMSDLKAAVRPHVMAELVRL
jgi:predicted nucleotidyltransferase